MSGRAPSGRHLSYFDANAGFIPGAGANGRPYFLLYGANVSRNFFIPMATNRYDAWQSNVKKRLSRGLFMTASYTWSKALGINAGNSDSGLRFYVPSQYSKNRAVADFDRTHSFVTAIELRIAVRQRSCLGQQWFCVAHCRRMEAQPEYRLVLRHAIYCDCRRQFPERSQQYAGCRSDQRKRYASWEVSVWGRPSMTQVRSCPLFVRRTPLRALQPVSAIWDSMRSVVPNSLT